MMEKLQAIAERYADDWDSIGWTIGIVTGLMFGGLVACLVDQRVPWGCPVSARTPWLLAVVGVLGVVVLVGWCLADARVYALPIWRMVLSALAVPLLWFIGVGGRTTAAPLSWLSFTAAWLCHMQQTREILGQWWKAPARGFWH